MGFKKIVLISKSQCFLFNILGSFIVVTSIILILKTSVKQFARKFAVPIPV